MHKDWYKMIDWKSLRSQKATLINRAEEKEDASMFNKIDADNLWGLVNVIDDIQDWAVDELGYDEKRVFGKKGRDNG